MERLKIKDIDVNERPREKMNIEGAEKLTNEELIAILINNGSRKLSAIGVAGELLKKTDGIKGLVDADLSKMMEVDGIGIAKATTIFAAMELSKRVSKVINKGKFSVRSPESIADIFMEELRYKKKEIVKVLLLDMKNNIITDIVISEGTLNASIVHPREVFLEAIKRSSNKIILIHNHPSGDPEPSKEDLKITNRILEAGKIIGIELLDHIIIGDGRYCSLKERQYI